MKNHLRIVRVGDKIRFNGEKLRYTVQARNERYIVCTKPFNPKHTVIYCIIDTVALRRGPENLVFGAGAETREQCEDMVTRLASGESELSYRRSIELKIDAITFIERTAILREIRAV